jgi:hypothetical protein
VPAAIGGYATGSRVGNGVYGYTNNIVASDTYSGYAVAAACDFRGGSSRAQVFMNPNGSVPTADTISHRPGELVVSADNRLWFCTAAGTPGTWEEVTGTRALATGAQSAANAAQSDVDALGATVGAIAPGPTFLPTSQRPFDSRPGEPGNGGAKGALGAGESRVVDLTVGTDFPAGAKAAIIHLTLAGSTSAGGFLSVYSAAVPNIARPGFSSLNWTSVGQIDANTTVTAVSPAGAIKIFALDGAHVAVDVIGYYA